MEDDGQYRLTRRLHLGVVYSSTIYKFVCVLLAKNAFTRISLKKSLLSISNAFFLNFQGRGCLLPYRVLASEASVML